jgi:hypothetical protein
MSYKGCMTEHEVARMPDWSICDRDGCIGVRQDGQEACLAHVVSQIRKAILAALRPGTDLDLRGTPIDPELLGQVLAPLRSGHGPPTLGAVQFDRAQFSGDAEFSGVRFAGDAKFDEAQFGGRAEFREAQFAGDAKFNEVQFGGFAWFDLAQFNRFAFLRHARFAEGAWFREAQFASLAVFDGVQVDADAGFGGAQFNIDAYFREARFTAAGTLGPILTARYLIFDRATFEREIVIEAVGGVLSCVGTRFAEAATLRLHAVEIVLDNTVFTKSSTIAFAPHTFKHFSPRAGRVVESFGEGPVAQVNDSPWPRPRLLSLRGVDVSALTLSELDLAACLFQGAYHLDQLRIEGARPFADTPAAWRLRFGRWWMPVWRRWSRRQTLAEEHHWRSEDPSPAVPGRWSRLAQPAWHGPACETPWWVTLEESYKPAQPVQLLTPDRLAVLYRALRKAQEDNKNEPGAADFYYGEMEMRRRDRHTPWAERVVLWLYWLVSGYGLRGLRALACLVVVIVGLAGLLQAIGFNGGDPVFGDALIYAAQSAISITSGNKALTEHVSQAGEVLRIVLRLAGPVLLGLALLSVRNRVKR